MLQTSPEEPRCEALGLQRAAVNVLHVAASFGHTALVRYLIEEAGVPVNRWGIPATFPLFRVVPE